MRLLTFLTVVFVFLTFAGQGSYAAEYHVAQDGTGDFTTSHDAIDAAVDGDVIVVHPGTYYESVHFDGKNVTLRSLDPEDEQTVASTIIDGGQYGTVVTFDTTEDETCLLSGFTITNGKSLYGAGILGEDMSSDTRICTLAGISNCTITGNWAWWGGGILGCDGPITNCTITGNSADQRGGGLLDCWGPISNCTITGNFGSAEGGGLLACSGPISNCTITGNSADMGGGLSNCNGPITNCTISSNVATGAGGGLCFCDGTISHCTISDNSATYYDIADGGGLCYCNGTISDCTITGNSAIGIYAGGGGLCDCDGTITNCTISGNSAHYWGGGLEYCDATITNCTISGNAATGQSVGYGGGLFGCVGTIANCTITANSAAWSGGGLCQYEGTIANCTISGNSAATCGGALCECIGSIINSIVWGNDAPTDPGLSNSWAEVAYCCLQDRAPGGEGNISDDPLFVTGPLGDYYLSCCAAGQPADSPCVDAGSGTSQSLGLDKFTTRTDSVPDAGMVDMGYHYPLMSGQNPKIYCSLNATEFAPGDALVGFIEAQNPGPDVTVDVYVAFVLPDGAIMSLTSGGLAIGTYPWVSNVVLPSGLHFGPSEVLRTTVPQGPGDYLFAAALTNPGRLEFIGQPSLFPFTMTDWGCHLR